MSWTEWFASLHGFFVHIPTAMAVFLPLPLIASQRAGRGIRPWWLLCRYLAVAGFLGLILAMLSGYLSVPGSAPVKQLVSAAGRSSMGSSLLRHQLSSTLSLVLGILTIMALFRRRRDHENLGWLPLVLGLLWSAAILVAHHHGSAGDTGGLKKAVVAPSPAPRPAPAPLAPPRQDAPEASQLLKLLDFQSLSPIHAEPVRSKAHGDRWIRTWVSPEALEGYRKGGPLPNGALVVMSTLEDRWGRPGTQAGPLYAMDIRQGSPSMALYWGRVPQEQRANFGGAERVFWRDSAPQLNNCTSCHAQGLAPLAQRSRWGVPRRIAAGSESSSDSPAQ